MRCFLVALLFFNLTCQAVTVGADRFASYVPELDNKSVALVVNPTSQTRDGHLLDALLKRGVNVNAIMSPEHGFRGDAGAGESIKDGIDPTTGLPVYSLYGKTKKPTPAMLEGIDIILFDIQDVGARFYTYLSTLHYVLEAAAEQRKQVIILDRPNPNIAFTAGPVLAPAFRSFVGMHPIPVLHGMTLGELALMIKGERWIEKATALALTVIPVADYTRTTPYSLPVPPSPNLPNDTAISLYPSLCLFEGTAVSVGRGTDFPFQLIGHPQVALGDTPVVVAPTLGAPSPKLNGERLLARLLNEKNAVGFDISMVVSAYTKFKQAGVTFFTSPTFFDKLAGSDALRQAIVRGDTISDIEQHWAHGIADFKQQRAPYLIYAQGQVKDEH